MSGRSLSHTAMRLEADPRVKDIFTTRPSAHDGDAHEMPKIASLRPAGIFGENFVAPLRHRCASSAQWAQLLNTHSSTLLDGQSITQRMSGRYS